LKVNSELIVTHSELGPSPTGEILLLTPVQEQKYTLKNLLGKDNDDTAQKSLVPLGIILTIALVVIAALLLVLGYLRFARSRPQTPGYSKVGDSTFELDNTSEQSMAYTDNQPPKNKTKLD
jgi:hypothetical protein